jgi:transposase
MQDAHVSQPAPSFRVSKPGIEEEGPVRVSTAFNRMLAICGAGVRAVAFTPAGIVVSIRLRRRRLVCPCGWSTRARYDQSTRRWRHLDAAGSRLFLEASIRRLHCRRCDRIRTEQVPWARPNARHTRDFEDMVVWLAQRSDKTTVAKLLRCSWAAVDAIVTRVVFEKIDPSRLDNLFRIGVDEISYRRGHRYLTLVVDHDTGHVVWGAKGRESAVLQRFFDELGPERCAQIEAVSMDLGFAYRKATREGLPHARQCFDPFHVVKMANDALNNVYTQAARDLELNGAEWRRVRTALRTGYEHVDRRQDEIIRWLRRTRHVIFRAWDMKEALRDLYRLVPPKQARGYLKRWISRARRSNIRSFQLLADRIHDNFDGILAAVELGLSNSRVEGVNAKVRLIQRRGWGYRSPHALIAMTYLWCGGITVQLPTQS